MSCNARARQPTIKECAALQRRRPREPPAGARTTTSATGGGGARWRRPAAACALNCSLLLCSCLAKLLPPLYLRIEALLGTCGRPFQSSARSRCWPALCALELCHRVELLGWGGVLSVSVVAESALNSLACIKRHDSPLGLLGHAAACRSRLRARAASGVAAGFRHRSYTRIAQRRLADACERAARGWTQAAAGASASHHAYSVPELQVL